MASFGWWYRKPCPYNFCREKIEFIQQTALSPVLSRRLSPPSRRLQPSLHSHWHSHLPLQAPNIVGTGMERPLWLLLLASSVVVAVVSQEAYADGRSDASVQFLKTPLPFSASSSATFQFEVINSRNGSSCGSCSITCKVWVQPFLLSSSSSSSQNYAQDCVCSNKFYGTSILCFLFSFFFFGGEFFLFSERNRRQIRCLLNCNWKLKNSGKSGKQ